MPAPVRNTDGNSVIDWIRNLFTQKKNERIQDNATNIPGILGNKVLRERDHSFYFSAPLDANKITVHSEEEQCATRDKIVTQLEKWETQAEKPTAHTLALFWIHIDERKQDIAASSEWRKIRHLVAEIFNYSITAKAEAKFNEYYYQLSTQEQKNVRSLLSSIAADEDQNHWNVVNLALPAGHYSGEIKNGQPHGKGILTNGEKIEKGLFVDGVFHKATIEDDTIDIPAKATIPETEIPVEINPTTDEKKIEQNSDPVVTVEGLPTLIPIPLTINNKDEAEAKVEAVSEKERGLKAEILAEIPLQLKEGDYRGSLVNGLPEGRGILNTPTGEIFDGVFEKGVLKSGVHIKKDGSRYEGSFIDGLLNGPGKFISKNETVYETIKEGEHSGGFINGVINGPGKITYENGAVLEGGFIMGNFGFMPPGSKWQ